jgi:hypothetical protein
MTDEPELRTRSTFLACGTHISIFAHNIPPQITKTTSPFVLAMRIEATNGHASIVVMDIQSSNNAAENASRSVVQPPAFYRSRRLTR